MRVVYYSGPRGEQPVTEYLAMLTSQGDAAVTAYRRRAEMLAEQGPALAMPFARLVDPRMRLYELRFGDHRIAYAAVGEEIVLLHAWRKRSQRLDEREATRARLRLSDWRARA
jgi:phage-related protein